MLTVAGEEDAVNPAESGGGMDTVAAMAQLKDEIRDSLVAISSGTGCSWFPAAFEKDFDDNFHMDYITACANLRAANYSLPQVLQPLQRLAQWSCCFIPMCFFLGCADDSAHLQGDRGQDCTRHCD